MGQKCKDPCPGTCGQNAKCDVINHSPICSCISGYTGDAFTRCYPIPRMYFLLLNIEDLKFNLVCGLKNSY
jgi:hypothetical protein